MTTSESEMLIFSSSGTLGVGCALAARFVTTPAEIRIGLHDPVASTESPSPALYKSTF